MSQLLEDDDVKLMGVSDELLVSESLGGKLGTGLENPMVESIVVVVDSHERSFISD